MPEVKQEPCPVCNGDRYLIDIQPHIEYVTHEMAMDAGDMQLENSPIEWGTEKVQVECPICHGTGIKPSQTFNIGDKLTDEHGHTGIVGIQWDDGDFCTLVNDAAHADPKKFQTGMDLLDSGIDFNYVKGK